MKSSLTVWLSDFKLAIASTDEKKKYTVADFSDHVIKLHLDPSKQDRVVKVIDKLPVDGVSLLALIGEYVGNEIDVDFKIICDLKTGCFETESQSVEFIEGWTVYIADYEKCIEGTMVTR